MNGTGVPLATPFDDSGDLDTDALADLTEWIVERGVDFIVPCGSNSEAELMTADERARAVEIVCEAVPDDVDVLAGTGHPGLRETLDQTERAADAGADGALVVTPFYFNHDQDALADYYRQVADEASIPIYLYSVPPYTNVVLEPETVGELASHENVAGMKDSSGNLDRFQHERKLTEDEEFELFVGSGGVYAPALDAGADGGILALANIAPERADEIHRLHRAGDDEAARQLNRRVADLNRAVTAKYGVPGLKAAMRYRGAPAGHVRSPHQQADADAVAALESLVDEYV